MKLCGMKKALVLTGAVLVFGSAAIAQPAAGGGGNNDNRQRWQNMTPEQREKARLQMRTQMIKGALTRLGYTDAELQQAVVDHMATVTKSAAAVTEKQSKVQQAVRAGAADDNLGVLLQEWRTALNEAKTARTEAAKNLDEKISYTKKPKLEAFLTLSGLVGDESALTQGLNPMGGFGGQQGARNGRGGRGGRGGGNAGGGNAGGGNAAAG